jgi:hypothetical protein
MIVKASKLLRSRERKTPLLNLIPVLRSAILTRYCRTAFAAVRFGKLYPATLVAMLLFCSAGRLSADVFTIGFEGFNDNTILTTQYPGLMFTNTIVYGSGITLNEFEFPPHSGLNIASDNGGPITIDFANPITSFSGYFTYEAALTLAGFDSSNIEVATAASAYLTNDPLNDGSTPGRPNELIQLSAGGISSVTITGLPGGQSFTMDDLTYSTTAIVTGVPEVSSLVLLFSVLGVVIFLAKIRTLRRTTAG